ncbi:hypothetical protein BX616_005556, partial [Lobosporangium transversale]
METLRYDALTNVSHIRPPRRSNQFSILAQAYFGPNHVLLHQLRAGRGRKAMQMWMDILDTDPQALSESHLLRTWGLLYQPSLPSIVPTFAPGSIASICSSQRPIVVMDYCEEGSLRECIDRGKFLSTSGHGESNWPSKIAVLKEVAMALYYIQRNMQGQQHGALSSETVFLDKDGHAWLSWHQSGATREDFESGACTYWRWLSPVSLRNLQQKLDQKAGAGLNEVLEIEADDMYAFGVLAWEIATEELPFESTSLPSHLKDVEMDAEVRFHKKPPQPLAHLIKQCLLPDKEKRPPWGSILSQLETLDTVMMKIADESNGLNHFPGAYVAKIPPTGVSLDDKKSKVVEAMESMLASTFYRKELPSHLDSITSSDPAFCGVSSLSMVLNALEIDPRRQWRGVWRWYSEEQLDCCASIDEMKLKGITFNQFACLAKCHAKVVAKRADHHTLEEFRRDVQTIASSEGTHLVLSFSRAALGQTGT